MKLRHLLLPFAACSLPLLADTAEVERHVRRGEYAQALAAGEADDASPEGMYWKGRALAGLRRLLSAVVAFSKVPSEHPLYSYAAKGIIYCAWQSEDINLVEVVAPLTACRDEEVAALATAALAEFQLRYTRGGDTTSLEELRRLVGKRTEWQTALRLLEVENLRCLGQFTEAIVLCREIEADTALDLATRHRARLALAEVYYAKEAATSDTAADEPKEEMAAEGMGEETLLQFIASNPESPLLQEAFRRLALHRAFTTSKYTARRLREWGEDVSKPRRAALALLMRQRAAFAGRGDSVGTSLANAASCLYGEVAAHTVILEQVRVLIEQGKLQQAGLLLNLLPEESGGAYRQFYRAATLPPASREAGEEYLHSAENAPGELLAAAFSNALFCACKSGDDASVRDLMQGTHPVYVRRALLLMHASLLQKDKPDEALQSLRELSELNPSPSQKAEARLIRAGINLKSDPPGTLGELLDVSEDELSVWTDEQLLRYYRLQLEAVDNLAGDSEAWGIERVRNILATCKRPAVTVEMLFNLAGRLTVGGSHAEALEHLEKIISLAETTETKARALLLAAETSAKLGSQEAFAKSIDLFEQCARLSSPYADRANIHRARVLMWINRTDEALQVLLTLSQREETMTASDRALAYTALADAHSMAGTEEGNSKALEYSSALLRLPELPREWYIRGKMHHATLCSRYGLHEEALADYRELLTVNPDTVRNFSKAQWYVLGYVGSGAIYRYLQLSRHGEAAALAEQMSAWFAGHPDEETATKRAGLFADWAADIRKKYY